MLFREVLDPATLKLLSDLQKESFLSDTRLVGGTALALQIGHRKSIDLDLFGKVGLSYPGVSESLRKYGEITQLRRTENNLTLMVDRVKVDIMNYSYPWIESIHSVGEYRLAKLQDITAMKLAANTNRGAKKDFIDIYYLMRTFGLKEMLNFYHHKYSDGNTFLVLKSLSYFDDAESEPMPKMLGKISWYEVKAEILESISKTNL